MSHEDISPTPEQPGSNDVSPPIDTVEANPSQTAPIPQVMEEELTGVLTTEELAAEEEIPMEVISGTAPEETTQNGTVFDALSVRMAELERMLAEEKSMRLRVLADLDNWRKRSARDTANAVGKAQSDVVIEFLPVLDNLELALAHATEKAGIEGMREGVAMVLKQFRSALTKFGIQELDASGHPFDPAFHEAMAQNPSDEVPPGFVIKQWQKGFMLGDRLIRPCRVVVSSGPGPSSENTPVDSSEE